MTNKELWLKELNRIKSFVHRASKRGYIFDQNVIPEMPKRITKSEVEKIKGITPQKLYKQAEFVVPHSGEIVSGTQGRKIERQIASRKSEATKRARAIEKQADLPKISSVMYSNLREFLIQLSTVSYKSTSRASKFADVIYDKKEKASALLNLLDECIAKEGEVSVLSRLEAEAPALTDAMNNMYMASDQDQVFVSAVAIATIIKGSSLTLEDAITYTEIDAENEILKYIREV